MKAGGVWGAAYGDRQQEIVVIGVSLCVAVCRSVLRCVAVWCSVVQCSVVRCSVV